MHVEFFVPGEPHGQSSVAVVQRGGKSWAFTNDSERKRGWKQAIWAEAVKQRPDQPTREAVLLELTFWYQRPRSHFKSNGLFSAQGLRSLYPVRPPDVSNILKSVEDQLKTVIFADDRQVVSATVEKFWADDANPPGMRVVIRTPARTPEYQADLPIRVSRKRERPPEGVLWE